MEFLTTKQKKHKARRLFVAYALLSVLVMLATYVLVSTALGFDLFRGSEVVQNGLIFVDSRPNNASVYLNDKLESDKTNAKYSLPESTYDVRIEKPGYRVWSGQAVVIGGTVEFLTYPRLLPLVPETITTQTHATVPVYLQSRDKQWLSAVAPDAPTQVSFYNLDNPLDIVRTMPLPESIVGNRTVQSITMLEWAGDNQHLLVRANFNDGSAKHIIIHRDKTDDFSDVTAQLQLSGTEAVGFWDGKKDQVYVKQASGSVVIGSLKDNSLSAQSIISDSVIQFEALLGERAVYTTRQGDELSVKYYNDAKTYTLTSTKNVDDRVLIKDFGYNKNDYVVIAGPGFDKTFVYRNFEKTITKSPTGRVAPYFTMPSASSYIESSRSNRFILGTDGNKTAVYDIEQREFFSYELPVPRPALVGWLDDVRLYALDSERSLHVMDFDGNNLYEIDKNVTTRPFVNSDVDVMAYDIDAEGAKQTRFIDIATATEQ